MILELLLKSNWLKIFVKIYKNIVNEINYLFSNEGKAIWRENYALLVEKMKPETKDPYNNAAKHILQ